jgi:hypothetical protein
MYLLAHMHLHAKQVNQRCRDSSVDVVSRWCRYRCLASAAHLRLSPLSRSLSPQRPSMFKGATNSSKDACPSIELETNVGRNLQTYTCRLNCFLQDKRTEVASSVASAKAHDAVLSQIESSAGRIRRFASLSRCTRYNCKTNQHMI